MVEDASHLESTRQRWIDACHLQLRVLAALVRRETRAHFGETRLGYLWAIIEPALHLVGYAILFGYILKRRSPLGGSLTLFAFTGLVPYFLYYKLATYLASAIDSNRALLNLPVVKPFDVILSRAILESVTYLTAAFVLFGYLFAGGVTAALPDDPLQLGAAVVATVGFGFGIGVINAVVRIFIRNWTTIFSLMLGPMFLLSGIWFLPEEVPQPYHDYLLFNPLVHYIMWFRCGFYGNYESEDLSRWYALEVTVISLAVGLALLRISRRKLMEPV